MIISYSLQNLALIKSTVASGGIISFPTDTLFALACDATNSKAIEKLFALKNRSIDKAAPVLVASLEEGMKLAEFSTLAYNLAEHFWPGALTMVLPVASYSLLSPLAVAAGTVGLRVPGDPISLAILSACGVPLLGTSANISGGPNLQDAYEIQSTFGQRIDLIIEGAARQQCMASTIIRVGDEVTIIRNGAIGEGDILRQAESIKINP